VSPKPKPIIPLMHARATADVDRLIMTPDLPTTVKKTSKTMLADTQRIMFAEIGLVFCKAPLYIKADIVQQIAAPKAASSPINVSRSFWKP
jgi:hypothetical protein